MTTLVAQPPQKLLGKTTPRLWTPPLVEGPAGPCGCGCALTPKTSRGFEVADFAQYVLGEPLLPWQRWLAIHALELLPDGTYRFRTIVGLCGRQNGKTSLLRTISLWRLYIDGARLVLGSAQDMSIARETWRSSIDMIKAVPDLSIELDRIHGNNGDEFYRLIGGGRYKITAANRQAGRGLSVDLLIMDELREQRSWAAWSALSGTTRARVYGQVWCISNAGDDESIVLNHLREAGLSQTDPSVGVFEWSGQDGCDLDDRIQWAQANPGLGYTITEQAIRSALGTDPPNVFRTETLCQRVDALDSAVDVNAWKAGADARGSLESVRDRIIACLDVAPDGQHITLAGAALLDDGRIRVEVFAAWNTTSEVRRDLKGLLQRISPAAVSWFPSGPAAALAPEMRELGAVEIKGSDVGETCQGFSDLVTARRIIHPDDPLLNAHIAGSKKYYSADGWRFQRRGAGHVDAAYAAAGAVYVARTLPEPVKLPRPMVV